MKHLHNNRFRNVHCQETLQNLAKRCRSPLFQLIFHHFFWNFSWNSDTTSSNLNIIMATISGTNTFNKWNNKQFGRNFADILRPERCKIMYILYISSNTFQRIFNWKIGVDTTGSEPLQVCMWFQIIYSFNKFENIFNHLFIRLLTRESLSKTVTGCTLERRNAAGRWCAACRTILPGSSLQTQ